MGNRLYKSSASADDVLHHRDKRRIRLSYSGRVLIGGVDIKEIPKEQLMNTVSFVFQSSRLVKDTVLENVRFSNPQATREEAINALNAAQCADIIEKLPNGIDTVIGADGVYLSGGEQ